MNNLSAKLNKFSFVWSFFLKLAIKIFTMEAAKKGKKTSKPKKGSKTKKKSKKNNSMNFFTKFMLIILLLAILTASVFVLLKTTSQQDNKSTSVVKTESRKVAETESRKVAKTESRKDAKTESRKVAETESRKVAETESRKVAKTESRKVAETESDLKKTFKEQQNISGSWLSTEQGASLTIDNYGYRIDFFGIDASAPMTGMIIIKDNSINFISDGRDCKNEEGSYKLTFDKKNIRLVCKKDECVKRRNILEASWEWIEL